MKKTRSADCLVTGAAKTGKEPVGRPFFSGRGLDGAPVTKHSVSLLPSGNGFIIETETRQISVIYTTPLMHCSTCMRRKTGWVVTYGDFLKVRLCWYCQTPLARRLIENIWRVNDGQSPLPAEFPSRESP